MKYGLWRYSRHPNYLGETMFWFGIYFMGLSSGIMPLWTILCPLLMLSLFIFISCPMMDKRSLKNEELDLNNNVEVCWLFSKSKCQLRFRGTSRIESGNERKRHGINSVKNQNRCGVGHLLAIILFMIKLRTFTLKKRKKYRIILQY